MEDDIKTIIIEKLKWEFFFEKKDAGLWLFYIPDCGGMADMVPKNTLQQKWCEIKLSHLSGVKRIWHTVWQVYNETALMGIEKLLSELDLYANESEV